MKFLKLDSKIDARGTIYIVNICTDSTYCFYLLIMPLFNNFEQVGLQ
jgi:hypothetical protein